MNRYSKIFEKDKREIVLLKSFPCKWGRCSFCDYIDDNSLDEELNNRVNFDALSNITGEFGVLEVINSGNIFELPELTLKEIKGIISSKRIYKLYFESHWIYKNRINEMRNYFGIETIVKTGIETFDKDFRENRLIKGFNYKDLAELKLYFDSVCLMVGIEGQSKESISRDIQIAMENFKHFTVNVYVNNSTKIKADEKLIRWFQDEFYWLNSVEKCDILWVNTDFGVGD